MYNTQQVPPPNSINQDILSNGLRGSERVSKNTNINNQGEEQLLYSSNGKNITNFESNSIDNSTSIRVVARFRPLNDVEKEIKETQQIKDDSFLFFNDNKTLQIKDGHNLTFTFDNIFQPSVSQVDVFNTIGKQTIDDVMNGYNGSIFAYGQTGSGKTYSMYGQDIFDELLMGIVPRAARQIFNFIKEQDLEIEYQIKIQMVEIYKESLCDLLHDSPEPGPELKIKEDPKRGTYVEGLTEVCIVSEEEIMTVICTGETLRHIASTKLNKTSSRSHSICIIEIVQKYPNDSEKRGILNLVDLAGSERVSKSHAKGEALEEAKKINFSLSMLGKVINSLTKNSSYIPYRDSKLTRLLKESLGGNNKTTLLVACSLYHSNLEETISSLRFAQRAKFIKNQAKMNIKNSPAQLEVIIQQLRQELQFAKDEISKLRIVSINHSDMNQAVNIGPTSNNNNNVIEFNKQDNEFMFRTCDAGNMSRREGGQQKEEENNNNNSGGKNSRMKNRKEKMQQLHNRPHQSLLAKNYDVIETNNIIKMQSSQFSSEFSSIPIGGTPNFTSPNNIYEKKLTYLIRKNENLEMKLRSKKQDIEALQQTKEEYQNKICQMKDKILSYKQKMILLEKKLAEYESDKDLMEITEIKQSKLLQDNSISIDVLTSQVHCLELALEESDSNCQLLLRDKHLFYQKSFKDFMKDLLKYNKIQVSEALDNFIQKDSINQTDVKKSYISQYNLGQEYIHQQQLISKGKIELSLIDQDILKQNQYSIELVNAVEEGSVPPEIIIYLLKNLLIDASLANYNLQRVLAVNRWRQVIEFGKHKIKTELCKVQENTIETLEQILEKTRKTHDKLRGRIDKLEYYFYDNRNYGDIVQLTEGQQQQSNNNTGQNTKKSMVLGNNNQISRKIITGMNNNNNNNNVNSSISLAIMNNNNNNSGINTKSRFVRTITNKTLGRAFNFIEKSPLSRASIVNGANGLANMSILSQYYNQQAMIGNINSNNNNGINFQINNGIGGQSSITPLRTCGVNSPVIFNFQSPTRRKSAMVFNKKNNAAILSCQNIQGQNVQPFEQASNNNNVMQQEQEQQVIQVTQEKNDPQTFEEAIGKICNSNQIQIKKNNENNEQQNERFVTMEDLEQIEQMNSVQEIKDYLRVKLVTGDKQNIFSQVITNLQPMFAQYQNAQTALSSVQYQQQHHLQQQQQLLQSQNNQIPQTSSNIIHNNTTNNNNLYGSSNDYYLDHQVASSSNNMPNNSTNLQDNQRQEYVLTLASDYLITSNSIIGPAGILNGQGFGQYYYQNDYLDRLQEKIVYLQEEVETQKCRAEEHKKAYYESKRQIEQTKQLMEDRESHHNRLMKEEIQQWENTVNKLQDIKDIELLRKQREIEKLHQILAQWIESYQQLEYNKGIKPQELEHLLVKTLSHKRSVSNMSNNNNDNQYYTSNNNYQQLLEQPRENVNYQDQSSSIYLSNPKVKNQRDQHYQSVSSQQNSVIMQAAKPVKKDLINGDNSPVAQEESQLDVEQTSQNVSQNNMKEEMKGREEEEEEEEGKENGEKGGRQSEEEIVEMIENSEMERRFILSIKATPTKNDY